MLIFFILRNEAPLWTYLSFTHTVRSVFICPLFWPLTKQYIFTQNFLQYFTQLLCCLLSNFVSIHFLSVYIFICATLFHPDYQFVFFSPFFYSFIVLDHCDSNPLLHSDGLLVLGLFLLLSDLRLILLIVTTFVITISILIVLLARLLGEAELIFKWLVYCVDKLDNHSDWCQVGRDQRTINSKVMYMSKK